MGGVAWDPKSGYAFVVTEDDGALGWIEKTKEGAPVPYDRTTLDGSGPDRGNFEVRMGGTAWPCQKPPWGRLIAVNTVTGDFAWQTARDHRRPTGRETEYRTPGAGGRHRYRGRSGVRRRHRDNRFRAIDAKTGKQLWVTKLDRRGNADPITYRARTASSTSRLWLLIRWWHSHYRKVRSKALRRSAAKRNFPCMNLP